MAELWGSLQSYNIIFLNASICHLRFSSFFHGQLQLLLNSLINGHHVSITISQHTYCHLHYFFFSNYMLLASTKSSPLIKVISAYTGAIIFFY